MRISNCAYAWTQFWDRKPGPKLVNTGHDGTVRYVLSSHELGPQTGPETGTVIWLRIVVRGLKPGRWWVVALEKIANSYRTMDPSWAPNCGPNLRTFISSGERRSAVIQDHFWDNRSEAFSPERSIQERVWIRK